MMDSLVKSCSQLDSKLNEKDLQDQEREHILPPLCESSSEFLTLPHFPLQWLQDITI